MNKLNILLLADHNNPSHAGAILDHINAIQNFSHHDITIINPRFGSSLAGVNLDRFDVVLIHYSIWIIWESYISTELIDKIYRSNCLTVLFIQDEYRFVDMTVDKIIKLGVDIIFSCIPNDMLRKVYANPRLDGVRIESVLTGYVPVDFDAGIDIAPVANRNIDIGYRSRTNHFWLGNLAYEKVLIAEGVTQRAHAFGLNCDISVSESDRIHGRGWPIFLGNCRTVLGTGSGASIVDFTGEIDKEVNDYLIENPVSTYAEVSKEVLSPYEGNVVIDTISPRIFEAAVLRTAMVMFESPYAGIIKPNIHYIPLERDFSNFSDVAQKIKSNEYLEELVENAYSDLIQSGVYSYKKFMHSVDAIIEEEISKKNPQALIAQMHTNSSKCSKFSISTLFFLLNFYFVPSFGVVKRRIKAVKIFLMDPIVMAFVIFIVFKFKLLNIKKNIPSLGAVISDLMRICILRKKNLTGAQSGRPLYVMATLYQETLCYNFFPTEDRMNNEVKTGHIRVGGDIISKACWDGTIKKVIIQSRVSIGNRPDFFEGSSLFYSIYDLSSLPNVIRQHPSIMGRLLSFKSALNQYK